MKFTLSLPPTTNHIYGLTSRGGFAKMYITKEGKAWFEESGYKLKTQYRKKTPIITPCEIWIMIYVSHDRDVDGSSKPILDVLQKNGVIKNDSLFYKMDIEKIKVKKGEEKVEIEIMGF